MGDAWGADAIPDADQPRRRRRPQESPNVNQEEGGDDEPVPQPSKKSWFGEDGGGEGGEPQPPKSQKQDTQDIRKHDDGIDDILDIPSLEDDQEDDFNRQVADAPRVRNTRVQSLRELDKDIKFSLPASGEAEIDLTILSAVLTPQEKIVEDDQVWEFDQVLQDVSYELQAETDKLEEGDAPASTSATSASASVSVPGSGPALSNPPMSARGNSKSLAQSNGE
eukprot:TRINITY_DN5358_c0_g1::TRINITY_DN5358_c0_g1_i1::g.24223::m.24223 TRINITY_DN5358_c0_g1::TRINITY_DN5358_c0_g1_i1::g.24223  ORF type:complete len:223 (-),score=67.88,sp/A8HYP5/IFT43_CHLRE/31.60/3e-22,IFT43/PF15305.1/1.3e-26,Herpes_LMP2/PF07415.6/10 TRINITY_DN5358_c0_g1_i1:107-775(-)